MPAFLEKKLKAEATKKGFKGKRADKYVFGGLNNIGAMHGSKITAKGERMQVKHEKDMAKRFETESNSYDFRKRRGGRKAK